MAGVWMSKESTLWLMLLALGGPVVPPLMWLAKRGRHRVAVLSAWTALTILYGLAAGLGVIARIAGQPEYIWTPLTAAGFPVALAFAFTLPIVRAQYRRYETRQTIARDLDA